MTCTVGWLATTKRGGIVPRVFDVTGSSPVRLGEGECKVVIVENRATLSNGSAATNYLEVGDGVTFSLELAPGERTPKLAVDNVRRLFVREGGIAAPPLSPLLRQVCNVTLLPQPDGTIVFREATGFGVSAVISQEALTGDGAIVFNFISAADAVFGLTADPLGGCTNLIDYAWNQTGGILNVQQSAVNVVGPPTRTWAANDIMDANRGVELRIERNGDTLTYYWAGILIYTSLIHTSAPLYFKGYFTGANSYIHLRSFTVDTFAAEARPSGPTPARWGFGYGIDFIAGQYQHTRAGNAGNMQGGVTRFGIPAGQPGYFEFHIPLDAFARSARGNYTIGVGLMFDEPWSNSALPGSGNPNAGRFEVNNIHPAWILLDNLHDGAWRSFEASALGWPSFGVALAPGDTFGIGRASDLSLYVKKNGVIQGGYTSQVGYPNEALRAVIQSLDTGTLLDSITTTGFTAIPTLR